jgi:non-ribosomal peptide synthetase component E (peptide arylation enzyme)
MRIVGRKADLITPGKNISAASVEAEVAAHPDVAMAAAIAVPDPVFGERVCAVMSMREPDATLTVDELCVDDQVIPRARVHVIPQAWRWFCFTCCPADSGR